MYEKSICMGFLQWKLFAKYSDKHLVALILKNQQNSRTVVIFKIIFKINFSHVFDLPPRTIEIDDEVCNISFDKGYTVLSF